MRIAKFALVGVTGVIVNEGLLFLLTEYIGLFYLLSSIIAIEASILSNFTLNDRWTFRDRRSGGSPARLFKYNIAVIGGIIINLSVLFVLTHFLSVYYLISNLFGVGAAFLWDYTVSNKWAWKNRGMEQRRVTG